MWNYIKGLLRIGIPFDVGIIGFMTLFADVMALSSAISFFTNPKTMLEAAILFLVMCPVAVLFSYAFFMGFKDSLSPVPYWGKHFGKDNIFKLLAEDKFSPYVTRDGYVCHDLKVSESGRWMKIAGRYYPIPLVKGLNVREDHLELINGDSIEIRGMKSRATLLKEGLKEMFPPTMSLAATLSYDDIPSNAAEAFRRVWKKDYKELAQADWFEIRYLWEEEYSKLLAKRVPGKKRKKALDDITEEHLVYKHMFRRVLYDDEIAAVAKAVKNNEIERPYALFDITNYDDEYCVCNAIKVLGVVGYPDNMEWIEFLFKCLKDVQKSYCDDAVLVLKENYPREVLIEHIDAEILKAHEANDLVWAAGLISLAKAIDYEISLEDNKADKDKEKEVSVCGTI